jgi:MoaA/NifB/PqqE/SkfB family radical SAM enzyme
MLISSTSKKNRVLRGLLWAILKRIIRREPNPFKALSLLNRMLQRRRAILDSPKGGRYVHASGRYFWESDAPGWPSAAFDKYIDNELGRYLPDRTEGVPLQTVIFAITSRCPLKCKHCFEWDNLDAAEHLSPAGLGIIMDKIWEQGIRHVQLSGGEPLTRFKDLLSLTEKYGREMDLWILTSGFGLTAEKAEALKQAGLTGANISLDHWEPSKHNDFRNHQQSFNWAREAASNCRQAGLAVSLSLCAAKTFITKENLDKYLALSQEWQVDFIRILEPRQAGRFTGQEAELTKPETDLLDSFYLKTNSGSARLRHPIVSYPGYYQRRTGCFGAGDRYLYIDSRGDFHACPFCLGKKGNALVDSFETALAAMREKGCHVFQSNAG